MKRLLALLLLAAPVSSFANIITYDFTVNGGSTGPLAGAVSTGYFSYDDAKATPYGVIGGVGMFTDFLFTWAGVTYDESMAEPSFLGFDSKGQLQTYVFGTNCVLSTCYGSSWTYDWTGVGYTTSSSNYFSYGLGNGTSYTGSISAKLHQVPEPGMLSLMFAGFAGVAAFTRLRRRV